MKGEKRRARGNKGGKEKKAMVVLLVFYSGYFAGEKKLLDAKDSFASNVFKKWAIFMIYRMGTGS